MLVTCQDNLIRVIDNDLRRTLVSCNPAGHTNRLVEKQAVRPLREFAPVLWKDNRFHIGLGAVAKLEPHHASAVVDFYHATLDGHLAIVILGRIFPIHDAAWWDWHVGQD